MSEPWTLRVLRAFRDEMNDARPAGVPTGHIGWPIPGGGEGAYAPFVFFDRDQISVNDGATSHRMTVVTGVVFRKDPSVVTEAELEQAVVGYYAMRAQLATAADKVTSDFNGRFEGVAEPHPEDQGVRPSDADDFDGTCAIGERWLVQGTE